MSTLQEEQRPLDLKIVSELVNLLPEDWDSGVLEAICVKDAGTAETIRASIFCEKPRVGSVVMVNDELQADLRRLYLAFKRHGCPWAKVRYTAVLRDDGDWEFKTIYEYPDK